MASTSESLVAQKEKKSVLPSSLITNYPNQSYSTKTPTSLNDLDQPTHQSKWQQCHPKVKKPKPRKNGPAQPVELEPVDQLFQIRYDVAKALKPIDEVNHYDTEHNVQEICAILATNAKAETFDRCMMHR